MSISIGLVPVVISLRLWVLEVLEFVDEGVEVALVLVDELLE